MHKLYIVLLLPLLVIASCNEITAPKGSTEIVVEEPDTPAIQNIITQTIIDSQSAGVFVGEDGIFIPANLVAMEEDEIVNEAGESVHRTRFNVADAAILPYAGKENISLVILGENVRRTGLTRLGQSEDGYAVFLEKVIVDGVETVRRRGKSFSTEQYNVQNFDEGAVVTFTQPLQEGLLLITYKDDVAKTILVKIE